MSAIRPLLDSEALTKIENRIRGATSDHGSTKLAIVQGQKSRVDGE